jgi:Cysteine-rich secretory protein family
MEILMRLNILIAVAALFSFNFVVARENPAPQDQQLSAAAVIREINLARENPKLYATFVAESRPHFMIEQGRAVDEAVRFLQKAHPLPALTLSAGMSRAAADHCADQIGGQLGHDGSDRSHGGERISRYGSWSTTWGENISYSRKTAREVVVALIIDDGTRSRGHRKNIFNPKFNYAGAAFGPHARYRTVCTIDFAGGYAERAEALVARNP